MKNLVKITGLVLSSYLLFGCSTSKLVEIKKSDSMRSIPVKREDLPEVKMQDGFITDESISKIAKDSYNFVIRNGKTLSDGFSKQIYFNIEGTKCRVRASMHASKNRPYLEVLIFDKKGVPLFGMYDGEREKFDGVLDFAYKFDKVEGENSWKVNPHLNRPVEKMAPLYGEVLKYIK